MFSLMRKILSDTKKRVNVCRIEKVQSDLESKKEKRSTSSKTLCVNYKRKKPLLNQKTRH